MTKQEIIEAETEGLQALVAARKVVSQSTLQSHLEGLIEKTATRLSLQLESLLKPPTKK